MLKNKLLRRCLVVAGVLIVPFFFAFSWWYCLSYYPRKNTIIGPVHTFPLDPAQPFLRDTLAVEKAKEAIALDGYDLAQWCPREYRGETGPDGTPDVYLRRNANPKLGDIIFKLQSGESLPQIRVDIEFTGDQVRCRVSYIKYVP
jgi:hypothetical protein